MPLLLERRKPKLYQWLRGSHGHGEVRLQLLITKCSASWTAPAVPFQELLTHHFISKALTSTYLLDLITIKVNIKGRTSFTLLQSEMIFQNLKKQSKRKEPNLHMAGSCSVYRRLCLWEYRDRGTSEGFQECFQP